MKTKIPLFALAVMLLISSCEVINPSEDIPTYLNIESVDVNSDGSTGTNSQRITDVQVNVDNEPLGIFPLPARIPILGEGKKPLKIFTVIKPSGSTVTEDLYPFYSPYNTEIDLVSSEDITINPVVEYLESAVFELVEDFEGANHLFPFDLDEDTETAFVGETNGFEGRSAVATLNKDHFLVESGSAKIPIDLTKPSFISYVEMNYKSDVRLFVRVVSYASNNNIASIKSVSVAPTNEWEKAYVDLSNIIEEVIRAPSAVTYRIVLSADLDADLFDSIPEAKVYVDNVKFITF